MNFEKLFTWISGIVIAFALSGHLGALQILIWKAQAKVIYESRTSAWGSPRFFRKCDDKLYSLRKINCPTRTVAQTTMNH